MRSPVPRQELVELVDGVLGNARQYVGEPRLRINVVHLRRNNDAVHGSSAPAPAIGSCEKPGLTAQRDTPQSPFRGVVIEADATIIEKACECSPAFEYV